MVAPASGLFAHFDLTDGAQCILLAYAVEHYRSPNPETTNENIRHASPLQLETANNIVQRIRASPLVTDIIRPFLNAQRSMMYNLPTDLLNRARDMEMYVTADTYNPGTPEYVAAQDAWRGHVQTQRLLAAAIVNGEGVGVGSLQRSSDNYREHSERDPSSGSENGGVDKRACLGGDDGKGHGRKKQKQIDNDAARARALQVGQYNSRATTGEISESDLEVRVLLLNRH
jgi:hypothetical protein